MLRTPERKLPVFTIPSLIKLLGIQFFLLLFVEKTKKKNKKKRKKKEGQIGGMVREKMAIEVGVEEAEDRFIMLFIGFNLC